MSKPELENLTRIGKLAAEAPNLAEYEGHLEIGEQFLADLIAAAETVKIAVMKLPVPTP